MKIGVLLSAYNSEDYIDECVSPWFELKDELDITIGCNSGMYKDYLDLGFTPKNKPTLHKLVDYDFDFLVSTGPKGLWGENDGRNAILHVLKSTCDVIWILDSDEFYTKDEIIKITDYVKRTPEYDWYSINFKNSIFLKELWVDGYCPPRIFRTDRHGGINEFYFDNHISYNDGTNFEDKLNSSIPRTIAWVKHYTWLTNDPRTKEKVPYQNIRFAGGCSFNYDNDKLTYNEKFYHDRGLEVPSLHETIEMVSNQFTINFSKNQNTFFIQNVLCFGEYLFRIYDGQNSNLIYESLMNLVVGTNYFIYPSTIIFNDIPDFNKFRVEVLKDNKIIHNEFIYLRYEERL